MRGMAHIYIYIDMYTHVYIYVRLWWDLHKLKKCDYNFPNCIPMGAGGSEFVGLQPNFHGKMMERSALLHSLCFLSSL